MSAVDQMQTLLLGLVMLSVGAARIDQAWAYPRPRLTRFEGWAMFFGGAGLLFLPLTRAVLS